MRLVRFVCLRAWTGRGRKGAGFGSTKGGVPPPPLRRGVGSPPPLQPPILSNTPRGHTLAGGGPFGDMSYGISPPPLLDMENSKIKLPCPNKTVAGLGKACKSGNFAEPIAFSVDAQWAFSRLFLVFAITLVRCPIKQGTPLFSILGIQKSGFSLVWDTGGAVQRVQVCWCATQTNDTRRALRHTNLLHPQVNWF